MTVFSPGLSKDRHNRIFKQKLGTLIPVPSEVSGVIVNYESFRLKITAILPPTKRTCMVQWSKDPLRRNLQREFELETPALILKGMFGKELRDLPPIPLPEQPRRDGRPPTDRMKRDALAFCRGNFIAHDVAIAALNTEVKNKILVKPFRMANVHDNSNICFGGGNHLPKNLRQANNLYWSAPFNCDFGGPMHDQHCPKIVHQYVNHEVPIFMHRHNLTQLCTCPPDMSYDNGYGLYCGGCGGILPNILNDEEKALAKRVGKIDLCTLEKCNEKFCHCRCHCCAKNCRCQCECDLTDHFARGLQAYSDGDWASRRLDDDMSFNTDIALRPWREWTPLTEVPDEDWTTTICGRSYNRENPKFLSYTGKTDGVFVSYDPKLIEDNADIVRVHGGWKALIGLYRQTKNGVKIDFGKKSMTLGNNKVVHIYHMWETAEQRDARESREYQEQQEQLRQERAAERLRLRAEERRIAERTAEARESLTAYIGESDLSEAEQEMYVQYFTGRDRLDAARTVIDRDRPITSSF